MNDTLYEFLENLGHYLDWEYAAPDWANWFAVDRDGEAHWFMVKPVLNQRKGEWRPDGQDWLGGAYACILPRSNMLAGYWEHSIIDLNEKREFDMSKKPQPRPGAHIWKAWADGKTVQMKMCNFLIEGRDDPDVIWSDADPRHWETMGPDDEPAYWRIKPHKRQLRFRIAITKMPAPMEGRKEYIPQTAYDRDQERMIQADPDFYAWATDWIEVAVPND